MIRFSVKRCKQRKSKNYLQGTTWRETQKKDDEEDNQKMMIVKMQKEKVKIVKGIDIFAKDFKVLVLEKSGIRHDID